jgi:hypothetical protein
VVKENVPLVAAAAPRARVGAMLQHSPSIAHDSCVSHSIVRPTMAAFGIAGEEAVTRTDAEIR